MTPRISATFMAVLIVSGICAVAAAGEKVVELTYERPAEYEIPAGIRRIGIAQFTTTQSRDAKWCDIASDRLASQLDEFNRKYQRYELIDRKHLQQVLAERDLQLAIADSATAVKLGKLANLDAMVYGSVTVTARDEQATRTTIDVLGRGLKKVRYTKRYCQATISFTLTNSRTGKMLTTLSVTRDYDSEKDKENKGDGIGKVLGFGGDKLPPADPVLSHLVDECVQEFIGKITPHEVAIPEELPKGKTKIAETGRKLAVAGEYIEALECFEGAIAKRKTDHASMFNAGVMCEALGRLEDAESYYTQAFKVDAEEQYVLARARVRKELVRQKAKQAADKPTDQPGDADDTDDQPADSSTDDPPTD